MRSTMFPQALKKHYFLRMVLFYASESHAMSNYGNALRQLAAIEQQHKQQQQKQQHHHHHHHQQQQKLSWMPG